MAALLVPVRQQRGDLTVIWEIRNKPAGEQGSSRQTERGS